MASSDNRKRRKWQDYSGSNAKKAEDIFLGVFEELFLETTFSIRSKPKEFGNIYVETELKKADMSEIYIPAEPIKKHGIVPDYAIENTATGKTIYVEVKRQDGWVEGGKRSDGRGNAHERSCKFFTPGLLNTLRRYSNIDSPALPFWVVFIGNITKDPCRVREVTYWYEGVEDHFFFWRDVNDDRSLIGHFESKISPLLR